MSFTPNYYYQSPFIADAARNLSEALKPPDKEKQLALQQAQWQQQREQVLAQQHDTDREDAQAADAALAELGSMEPAVNPVTGKTDEEQTDKNARAIAQRVLDKGGVKYVDALDKEMGKASPKYQREKDLANIKTAALMNMMAMRFGFEGQLQTQRDKAAGERTDSTNQNRLDVANVRGDRSMQLAIVRHQQRMAELRTHNPHVQMVSPATSKLLVQMLDQKEAESGGQMSGPDYDKMLDLATSYLQETGNPAGAVEKAWAKAGPSIENVDDPDTFMNEALRYFGHNPQSPKLTPHFETPQVDSGTGPVAPRNLSDPVIDPRLGGPPASAAPAPARGGGPQIPTKTYDDRTLPAPRNKQDYDAMPSGPFFDPNGVVRVKP